MFESRSTVFFLFRPDGARGKLVVCGLPSCADFGRVDLCRCDGSLGSERHRRASTRVRYFAVRHLHMLLMIYIFRLFIDIYFRVSHLIFNIFGIIARVIPRIMI